ncbi:alpha/beta hydrolase domain-containing protein [Nocardioides conyzicola]|uniref:Alpha/beta hydrolase domain-containing protein n=1 Tax=Nocardioides conyzicola TaxID=1651781 RepID=A0ABP8X501_9ACTN
MPAPRTAAFTPLTSGNGVSLMAATPGPDLDAASWVETELSAAGTAVSYAEEPHPDAAYRTRVVVRRPASPASSSGTLVVEWLNVSSGSDAGPDWTYLADELVRQGHAWAGVSAQFIGVEGGSAAVDAGAGPSGLKTVDPERYGALLHPGDAYSYDIYTQVARGLAESLGATCVLAIGESQSAFALTTYVNVVHAQTALFDGFLIHSRPGSAMPLGTPGAGIDLAVRIGARPTPVRDDTDVPVIIVQTEGDLFGRIAYLPARQPDATLLRLWEVAGAAHADRFQIGEFETFLGCPDPVNRGQQAYVVRAALRWLESWARGGAPAPSAPRLSVEGDGFVLDPVGNVVGGVRTPVVDAPADVLSGYAAPGASPICALFGRTLPLPHPIWSSHDDYLTAYAAATDAAISAGFVLAEDRDAVLAEARPDPLPA